MLERRGEMREQLRQLGEFRIAGAERRRALALEPGEPVEHMHRIVGAALLAVIDDVDAAFDLLGDHMRDRLAHRGVELGLARAAILLFGEQELDHLGGARQAAGMRRENPVGAAFHARSISTCRVDLGPPPSQDRRASWWLPGTPASRHAAPHSVQPFLLFTGRIQDVAHQRAACTAATNVPTFAHDRQTESGGRRQIRYATPTTGYSSFRPNPAPAATGSANVSATASHSSGDLSPRARMWSFASSLSREFES